MIRFAEPAEARAVAGFFEAWQSGLSAEVLGEADVAFADREGETAVCLASPDIAGLPAAVLEGADHVGVRIGTWEDGAFALDLQGAVLAAPHTRHQVVRVNEHAARLFIYGRDILAESVLAHDRRLDGGDACIVVNPRWEALGIGEVMGTFKGGGPVVRPVHDLGAYLRDQD